MTLVLKNLSSLSERLLSAREPKGRRKGAPGSAQPLAVICGNASWFAPGLGGTSMSHVRNTRGDEGGIVPTANRCYIYIYIGALLILEYGF